MLRLMIVVPVYAFVAIFLPRQPDIARLLSPLFQVHPDQVWQISFAALIVGGAGIYALRQPQILRAIGWPLWGIQILMMGLVGVCFSGVFNLFEAMSGTVGSLHNLVIIPVAFLIAEGVYVAIQWRLNRPSSD